jgi:topoisomerase-4 subunit B
MNAEQLWETTMDPARRTLIRVKIGEYGTADSRVSVLMGDEVDPRREWIDNNVVFDYDDNFVLEDLEAKEHE